jgi:hypothetical protein
MHSIVKELHQTLTEFVQQDRYRVLVIRLTEDALPLVLKLIQTLDQQEGAHVFILSADAVPADAGAYVTAVLGGLEAQLRPVNELRVADGQKPWPPFPAECSDARLGPAHRLTAGVLHAAGLVPGAGEHHLVFSLLPLGIANGPAYAAATSELVARLAAADGGASRKVRLILRDDGAKPELIERFRREKNPDVLIYEPDLSPPAIMDGMARDVADPRTPEPERMQLLTELACLDMAHDRFEEATAKLGIAYDYFRRLKVPVMQAFVLQCVGDVLRRTGNLPLARERYAQGLAHALETQAVTLMMSLAHAVGDTSLALRRYEDAEGHLEIARKIAATLRNVEVQAEVDKKLEQVRRALGKPAQARGHA